MGLVFGVIFALAAPAMALFVVFAAGLSDNPDASHTANADAVMILIAGWVIAGICFATHGHAGW